MADGRTRNGIWMVVHHYFWGSDNIGIAYLVSLVSGGREKHGESPLHILKRRYAKGEITAEEFEKMKDAVTEKICKK